MKELTIEEMLQIGHGCGLSHLEEAYANIMNHYDLFFPIEGFVEARANFNKKLEDAGLVEDTPFGKELCDISIVDAAAKLGIELKV